MLAAQIYFLIELIEARIKSGVTSVVLDWVQIKQGASDVPYTGHAVVGHDVILHLRPEEHLLHVTLHEYEHVN